MPGRKKLRKEIYGTDFDKIERQSALLERAINHASIGLNHYTPHGQAIMKLRKDLRAAVNILGNRPADYFRPSCHVSPSQAVWHFDVERDARASLPQEGDDDRQSTQKDASLSKCTDNKG